MSSLVLLLSLVATTVRSSPSVDPLLMDAISSGNTAVAMVTMNQRPSEVLEPLRFTSFQSRDDRINAVVSALKKLKDESQSDLIDFLTEASKEQVVHFECFWISNTMAIYNFRSDLLEGVCALNGVQSINLERGFPLKSEYENPSFIPEAEANAPTGSSSSGSAWGVGKIQASDVQAQGIRGQNVIVGIIDSGVRRTHEALSSNYRGDYGWFDPSGGTSTPSDPVGHGTHTTGIICGTARNIGVAPGATWMACRGCQSTSCFEADLISCGQFMACPTLPNGQNPDCSKAPDVINNSWSIGVGGNGFYDTVINSWRAAGIIPVFAIGNTGPNCNTTQSPGDYATVIGVGATTINDDLASISSVGPSARTNGLKPDLVAPGVGILSASSSSDTDYEVKSGTSFSCPHVTGTVALMLSMNAGLSFDQIRLQLQSASVPINSRGQACGGVPDTQYPNFQAGYGRVNAQAAVKAAAAATTRG